MLSGELARRSGVSTDSLRHYERLGVLARPPRTVGGYQDYPPTSLDRVRLIRNALSIGFSLAELTAVLKLRDRGKFPCREARRIAETKLNQLRVQIKDLTAMRRQIETILKDWDARLVRTGTGKPARLLENLPDALPRTRLQSRPLKSRIGDRT
jgi:DNA-binding transcriptional MerR regulator